MKKTGAFLTVLFFMGTAKGYVCPPLSVEQTQALIQNKGYTDNRGTQWNLEMTMAGKGDPKMPIDFMPLLNFLKTPGLTVRLVKSTFEKQPPSPSPAPLMNARLQKHLCDYAVMKKGEASDTMGTQELYEFRLTRQ